MERPLEEKIAGGRLNFFFRGSSRAAASMLPAILKGGGPQGLPRVRPAAVAGAVRGGRDNFMMEYATFSRWNTSAGCGPRGPIVRWSVGVCPCAMSAAGRA